MFDMYNINETGRQDNNEYYNYYTIKKGDSIYKIAKDNNINPELLALLNGLNLNDYIYPNQVILIPKAMYSYYVTKSGDTLSSVANTFKTNTADLLNYNPSIFLSEGQLIVKKK